MSSPPKNHIVFFLFLVISILVYELKVSSIVEELGKGEK